MLVTATWKKLVKEKLSSVVRVLVSFKGVARVELSYHQHPVNGHSSHPWSHLLFGAIGVLGKSAVSVVSKFVGCVALEMIQLVIMCPALSKVMN